MSRKPADKKGKGSRSAKRRRIREIAENVAAGLTQTEQDFIACLLRGVPVEAARDIVGLWGEDLAVTLARPGVMEAAVVGFQARLMAAEIAWGDLMGLAGDRLRDILTEPNPEPKHVIACFRAVADAVSKARILPPRKEEPDADKKLPPAQIQIMNVLMQMDPEDLRRYAETGEMPPPGDARMITVRPADLTTQSKPK